MDTEMANLKETNPLRVWTDELLRQTPSLQWSDTATKRLYEVLNKGMISLSGNGIIPQDTAGALSDSDWARPLSEIQGAQEPDRHSVSSALTSWNPSQRLRRSGMPCGKAFKKGEGVYRCRDCGLDDTCVLCSACFNASNHVGHNTSFTINLGSGGCCDCGDAEAWKSLPDCPWHSPSQSRNNNDQEIEIDDRVRSQLSSFLNSLLDFVVSTFHRSYLHKRPPVSARHFVDNLNETWTSNDLAEMFARRRWLVVLWNDEKHSFDAVIEKVKDAAGCQDEVARRIAEHVDSHGRDVVDIYEHLEVACHVATQIAQIDLMTTVHDAGHLFREETAGAILKWLKDACFCSVNGNEMIIRELIGHALRQPFSEDTEEGSLQSRLEYLIVYDIRLWKQARSDMRELLVTLLASGVTLRSLIVDAYRAAYPVVMDLLIRQDREPEHSVAQLSVQIFTVPSVVEALLKDSDILGLILRGLEAYFVCDESTFSQLSLQHWRGTVAEHSKPLDVSSAPFKRKRYVQLLQDLRYLLANPSTQHYLRTQPRKLGEFADFLANFQSVTPATRAVNQHIEWETDIWVTAFTINLQLMRIEGHAAEAYRSADLAGLRLACQQVVSRILLHQACRYRDIALPGFLVGEARELKVVDYVVSKQPCSFHHPLHRLLGGLLSCLPRLEGMREVDILSLLGDEEKTSIQAIFDEPLRTIVLMAQIRCGLWVRNGMALRQQQLHYFDTSQRDFTQDTDNFLLQCLVSSLDSETGLMTILTRFELNNLLQGTDSRLYDAVQTDQMLEEMLLSLTAVVNEPALLDGWDEESHIRRHIVQWLALGPITFSELTRKIPERAVDHPNFDRILAESAMYKAPISRNESGIYHLHPEGYDDVDPLFIHYTRNQREDAERTMLKHRGTRVGTPFYLQKSSTSALREGVTKIMTAPIFGALLICCFRRCLVERKTNCSSLLDITLSLTSLALMKNPMVVFRMLVDLGSHYNVEVLNFLFAAVGKKELSEIPLLKAEWIIQQAKACGMFVQDHLRDQNVLGEAADRRLKLQEQAQARKQALMRQFAEAQKTFASQLSNSELSEEDSEGEEAQIRSSNGSCIVCQEDLDNRSHHAILSHFQPSGLLTLLDPSSTNIVEHPAEPSAQGKNGRSIPTERGGRRTLVGVHANSCGHSMHLHCLASFEVSVEAAIAMQFSRNHPEEPRRLEFTCPLCKSVYNVLLPCISPEERSIPQLRRQQPIKDAMGRIQAVLRQISHRLPPASQTRQLGVENVIFYTVVSIAQLQPQLSDGRAFEAQFPTAWDLLKRLWSLNLLDGDGYFSGSSDLSNFTERLENDLNEEELLESLAASFYHEPFCVAISIAWRGRVDLEKLAARLHDLYWTDLAKSLSVLYNTTDIRDTALILGPEDASTHPFAWALAQICEYILAENGNQESAIMRLLPEERAHVIFNYIQPVGARWSLFGWLVSAHVLSPEFGDHIGHSFGTIFSESWSSHLIEALHGPKEVFGSSRELRILGTLLRRGAGIVSSCISPVKPSLVTLPSRLERLFENSQHLHCHNCKKPPNDPAICLICGQLVCSQSFCCMANDRGECNSHMDSCGVESGIFLLPKKSVAVLLHAGKGTFMPAPYLDIHGEADIGYRRGRPQFLHKARYDELQEIWSRQAVPSVIARKLDAIYDTGGWETL